MSQIIDHLKRRIAEAEAEYRAVGVQRQEVMKLEQKLHREIDGYKAALEGELRRSGQAPVNTVTEKPTEGGSVITNGHGSAVQTILGYIQTAGSKGITRRDIATNLANDGVEVHRNYPYVVISKLKEKELIEERNERLFLK